MASQRPPVKGMGTRPSAVLAACALLGALPAAHAPRQQHHAVKPDETLLQPTVFRLSDESGAPATLRLSGPLQLAFLTKLVVHSDLDAQGHDITVRQPSLSLNLRCLPGLLLLLSKWSPTDRYSFACAAV